VDDIAIEYPAVKTALSRISAEDRLARWVKEWVSEGGRVCVLLLTALHWWVKQWRLMSVCLWVAWTSTWSNIASHVLSILSLHCRQQRIYRAFDLSAKKKGLYEPEDPYSRVSLHPLGNALYFVCVIWRDFEYFHTAISDDDHTMLILIVTSVILTSNSCLKI
jgi:hypothetical protein